MDVMPQGNGPYAGRAKAPSRNLLDAEPTTLGPLMRAVQTVARGVMRAFAADGVTVIQFNEAPAGQSVFHLHVHVIPRFDGVPLKPHTGDDGGRQGARGPTPRRCGRRSRRWSPH